MKPYEDSAELGVYDLWQLQKNRVDLCKQYLDDWVKEDLDAILGMLLLSLGLSLSNQCLQLQLRHIARYSTVCLDMLDIPEFTTFSIILVYRFLAE